MLNKAVINLNVIRENAIKIKRRLGSDTKFCAVVKADAYGHGDGKVANALYDIVDYYAVALVEEGIRLRESGIDKPVLVLGDFYKTDVESAVRFDLTLTVTDIRQVDTLYRECKKQNKSVGVHIKYDTGMNRFGVKDLTTLRDICEKIQKKKTVRLEGLYSHYACPEVEEERKKATDKFLLAINVVKGYNSKAICHISASGGFLFGEYFDMVRIGILLYGYYPFKTKSILVKPSLKVYARVVKNYTVNKRSGCLYGKRKLKSKTDVSLIRFGYADGLPRKKIDGLINNRCMDVSAIRRVKIKRVNVIADMDKLTKEYKTIPYEILTKCTIRAEKKYIF